MLSPGTQVGSYTIVEYIASGGMAMVYKAQHTRFGDVVAVKVMLPHLAQKPNARYRFEQEAYVQRQLEHPNIVRVFDVAEVADSLAMIMEYVDGPTMEQWLEANPGPKSDAETLSLLGPVLDAVAYAHKREVVHRDLKPANILMSQRQDGTYDPKVTDFGLVKVLAESGGGLTQAGTVMGTAPYMAPEQWAGKTQVDPRADVFALGMICWRIKRGELPVDPQDNIALSELYTARRSIPRLESRLNAPVARALSIRAEERPIAAGALQEFILGRGAPSRLPATPPSSHPDTLILEPAAGTKTLHTEIEASQETQTVLRIRDRRSSANLGTEIKSPAPTEKGSERVVGSGEFEALTMLTACFGVVMSLLLWILFFYEGMNEGHFDDRFWFEKAIVGLLLIGLTIAIHVLPLGVGLIGLLVHGVVAGTGSLDVLEPENQQKIEAPSKVVWLFALLFSVGMIGYANVEGFEKWDGLYRFSSWFFLPALVLFLNILWFQPWKGGVVRAPIAGAVVTLSFVAVVVAFFAVPKHEALKEDYLFKKPGAHTKGERAGSEEAAEEAAEEAPVRTVEREGELHVWLTDSGEIYLDKKQIRHGDLGSHLKKVASRKPDTRVLLYSDSNLPFTRVKEVIEVMDSFGFEVAISTTPASYGAGWNP